MRPRQTTVATPSPLAELRRIIPFQASAASDQLGWVGLHAARYVAAPPSELKPPALAQHRLVLFSRPPKELELRYDGINRQVPPPPGTIAVIPAASPVFWRWSGLFDWLHVFLDADLLARVGAEVFDLDQARIEIPSLDSLESPQLRATLAAVDAELSLGGAGGRLAAEGLANVLAVQLLRHLLAPRVPTRSRDGALPRTKLRAAVEFIESHLTAAPTLAEMAAVVQLSPYHFARQFKAATGLPPHQYVISRRVEYARELLRQDTDQSLADVALSAGFTGQSQFTGHFKRLVGVTPRQFQQSERRRG
jgi:AraC family transcriptional regulator